MELTIGQLIKITIGVFVVVIVVGGLYLFSTYINDFFGNVVPNESAQNNQQVRTERSESEVSLRCSDCGGGFFGECTREDCLEIDRVLNDAGQEGCEYAFDPSKNVVGECIPAN